MTEHMEVASSAPDLGVGSSGNGVASSDPGVDLSTSDHIPAPQVATELTALEMAPTLAVQEMAHELPASDAAPGPDGMPKRRGRRPKLPGEPAKPRTAAAFYASDRKEKMKTEGVEKSAGDLNMMCRDEWKGLSDVERAPYEEQARIDRERYEAEKQEYVPAPLAIDPSLVTKAGRLKKDPLRPKHPHSAYFYYLETNRPDVQATNANLSVPELTKTLAAGWKALSEEEKTPYMAKALADRERFENELRAYTPTAEFAAVQQQYAEVKAARKQAKVDAAAATSTAMPVAASAIAIPVDANGVGMTAFGVVSSVPIAAADGSCNMEEHPTVFAVSNESDAMKRKRGRPKGSKNKPKDPNAVPPPPNLGVDGEPLPKRGRGRPKGSKNRPKDAPLPMAQALMLTVADAVVDSAPEGSAMVVVDKEIMATEVVAHAVPIAKEAVAGESSGAPPLVGAVAHSGSCDASGVPMTAAEGGAPSGGGV